MKFFKFEEKSYDAKVNAQRNLIGRTHYVDDATLKCFSSRILKTVVSDNGLLFAIVESYARYDGSRLFRPVVFNVIGETVDRVNGSDGFKTKKQAIAALWQTLENIDAVEHTKQALQSYIEREQNNVKRLLAELE